MIYQDSMRPGIAPIAQVSYGGKGGLFSLLEKNQPHFLAMQMQHQHLNVSWTLAPSLSSAKKKKAILSESH